MPQFGQKSASNLATCERDIQTIMMEVVKHFDCSIIEGHRSAETQNSHWQKGRENDIIVDKSKVVTYKDGYDKKSKHQGYPSEAVDVVPYPSMWKDKNKLIELRGVVKYCQAKLLSEGKIEKTLDNGGDLWDGWDLPHYEIHK